MNYRGWRNTLRTLFQRRAASVPHILGRYLRTSDLEKLVEMTADRRHLIEGAAELLGLSEVELAAQVASRLDLPFLSHVSFVDPDLLPSELSIGILRRAGSIVRLVEGKVVGLTCVDPSLVHSILPSIDRLPLAIAPWSRIQRALDESDELSRERARERASEARKARDELAKRCLGLVVEEALAYGAKGGHIRFRPNDALYSFTTGDGRSAHGAMKSSAAQALRDCLGQSETSWCFDLVLPKRNTRHQVECFRATETEVRFELQFGEEDRPRNPRPAALQIVSREQTSEAPAGVTGSERRVLVVDDNATFAHVLKRFLHQHHLKTVHAENGERALQMIQSGEVVPDVIISDVHMPVMNGRQFIQELRKLPAGNTYRVIVLTSDDDVNVELEFLHLGVEVFIGKNEDPRLLGAHVKRLVPDVVREAA